MIRLVYQWLTWAYNPRTRRTHQQLLRHDLKAVAYVGGVMIRGGYYIKARAIQESAIMRQPPYVREVWDWLLMKANHKEGKSSGTIINRGQLFTSFDDIREGLCWYVGYRKVSYTKDHMKKAMKALKKALMISTDVSTRGLLVTICNYDIYQTAANYESTNESTDESTTKAPSKHRATLAINKNGKNNKNKEEMGDDIFNLKSEDGLTDKQRSNLERLRERSQA